MTDDEKLDYLIAVVDLLHERLDELEQVRRSAEPRARPVRSGWDIRNDRAPPRHSRRIH